LLDLYPVSIVQFAGEGDVPVSNSSAKTSS
jgi:hypothetical protein